MGKGGFLDRRRAGRLMVEAGIDALVVLSPENFTYATGATPGVAALWRRAGAALALLPADAGAAAAAVASDLFAPAFRAASDIADLRTHPIWVEHADVTALLPSNRPIEELVAEADARAGRTAGLARPATYDPRAAFALLREALAERGLLKARLGVEMNFLSVADHALLKDALPEATLVDSARLLERLRAVKAPGEIALLRQACEIGEAGMRFAVETMREGQSRHEVGAAWREGAAAEAKRRGVTNVTGAWEYTSVGPDPWGGEGRVAPGAVIKFDVGVLLSGYSSDSGRTFTWGTADAHTRKIHAGLLDAFRAGRAAFRPGATLGEVHRAAEAAMREAGFGAFSRGHYGHGVGASVWTEEWPFTAAGAEAVLEPGMVMAFETPFYVTGVGGFIIEDMLAVTDGGAESMNALPYELRELG